MSITQVLTCPPVIFIDLDDTILYFDKYGEPAWESVCREFGGNDQRIDPVRLNAAIKKLSIWYWRDPERHRIGRLRLDETRHELVALALETMGISNDDLAARISRRYIELRESMIEPVPGAIEALEQLSTRSRLALITNGESHKQRWKIDRFNLTRFFEQILIEEEVGFGKPDPRIFRFALSVMNAKPHESCMVGDNLEWDVASPQKLGIYAVWNDWRGKGLDPSSSIIPDRIIRSITELV